MKLTNKQNQLENALLDLDVGEFDGKVVSDLSELQKGYRGLVLHINDRGNVTLYRCFKNGNLHEIVSRV